MCLYLAGLYILTQNSIIFLAILCCSNEKSIPTQSFDKRMHWSQQATSSNNTREDSTHGYHQINTEIRLILFFADKDGEVLYSQQKQDWELTVEQTTNPIAKFRLKLKKVGETNRSFRDDLNQIPYNFAVEVTNRFKGLDLIECLKNYGWRLETLQRKQGSRPSPRKRNVKRQNSCLRGL